MTPLDARIIRDYERKLEEVNSPLFNPVRLFAAETYLRLSRAPVTHAAMTHKED